MVQIDVHYDGDLRCRLQHGPSGTQIYSDAPVDNLGRGSAFSPTDLCAASLVSCMVTTMGIAAQKKGFALHECDAVVQKIMTSVPTRRIAKLPVTIRIGAEYSEEQLGVLHHAALTCPVKESLSESVEITIDWQQL